MRRILWLFCVVALTASAQSQNPTTDGSGTITAGGTAQQLFRGVTPYHGWKVSLPTPIANVNTFICYVSDTVTNPASNVAGSVPVYAGGQTFSNAGQLPPGPVYLQCPTTGTPFSAQWW